MIACVTRSARTRTGRGTGAAALLATVTAGLLAATAPAVAQEHPGSVLAPPPGDGAPAAPGRPGHPPTAVDDRATGPAGGGCLPLDIGHNDRFPADGSVVRLIATAPTAGALHRRDPAAHGGLGAPLAPGAAVDPAEVLCLLPPDPPVTREIAFTTLLATGFARSPLTSPATTTVAITATGAAPGVVPGPRDVVAVPGAGAVTLTWTGPGDTVVAYADGVALPPVRVAGSPATVGGLVDGTPYTFSVALLGGPAPTSGSVPTEPVLPAADVPACAPGAAPPPGLTVVRGSEGPDRLEVPAGPALVLAGAGDDHVIGSAGDDVICAGEGNDIVVAGAGDDRVSGGPGRDVLLGGAGDDALHGGPGLDVLDGGAGDDVTGDPDPRTQILP